MCTTHVEAVICANTGRNRPALIPCGTMMMKKAASQHYADLQYHLCTHKKSHSLNSCCPPGKHGGAGPGQLPKTLCWFHLLARENFTYYFTLLITSCFLVMSLLMLIIPVTIQHNSASASKHHQVPDSRLFDLHHIQFCKNRNSDTLTRSREQNRTLKVKSCIVE